jgi:hypothetical protein
MEPIKRLYNGADAHMTERARVTYTLMSQALALFTNFNSTMTVAYLQAFLDAINKAGLVVADNTVVGQQEQLTAQVVAKMRTARTQYKELRLFVEEAFPNSPGTLKEFAFNKYAEVRNSADEMVDFLDEMSKAAVKYTAELLTAGFSQVRIDAIETTKNELIQINNDQEVFISGRPKLTEDRIIVMNTCYKIMTLVNASAQFVYLEDYAMRKQFVYNPSSNSNDGLNNVFIGTVEQSSVKTVTTVDEDAEIMMSNTGTEKLYFALSPTEGAGGYDYIVMPGETLTKSSAEMSPDGDGSYLLVKNPETVVGNYEVVVVI